MGKCFYCGKPGYKQARRLFQKAEVQWTYASKQDKVDLVLSCVTGLRRASFLEMNWHYCDVPKELTSKICLHWAMYLNTWPWAQSPYFVQVPQLHVQSLRRWLLTLPRWLWQFHQKKWPHSTQLLPQAFLGKTLSVRSTEWSWASWTKPLSVVTLWQLLSKSNIPDKVVQEDLVTLSRMLCTVWPSGETLAAALLKRLGMASWVHLLACIVSCYSTLLLRPMQQPAY